MKQISLILLISLMTVGCETTSLSTGKQAHYSIKELHREFCCPAVLNGLENRGMENYEKDNPGLGYSYRYEGISTKVDIYIYDLGFKDIPDGISSDIIEQSFVSAVRDVMIAGDRGAYEKVQYHEAKEVKVGNLSFGVGRLSFNQDGIERESFVALTGVNGRIFKLRATFETAGGESYESQVEELLFEIAHTVIGFQR